MDEGKKTCPGCQAELAPGAVLCVGCGYHLGRGKRLTTESKRFRRQWDFGLTVAAQAGAVVFAFLGAAACTYFFWPWGALAFVGALGFLFMAGLFGRRVILERGAKGDVVLTIVQWILFRPTVMVRAELREYEAAYTSVFQVGRHSSYLVEIRGANVPTVLVYDGTLQRVMKDVLDCLQYEGGLEIRRGNDF